MEKTKIILAASIAAVLVLSCSDGGSSDGSGNGNGYSADAEVYALAHITADQFTYMLVEKDKRCMEGGILGDDSLFNTIKYSISDSVITWEPWSYSDDTLLFKGSSNELAGTWTRTKDKAASCILRTETYCIDYSWEDELEDFVCNGYDEDFWYRCKEDYDITEVAFAATTVRINRDLCETEKIRNGETWQGGDSSWKVKPINCNTYEIYKETEKATVKKDKNSIKISYNGKSCKMSEPSKSQKESACKEAWDKYQDEDSWEDYYYDILWEDFYKCMDGLNLPAGLFTNDDYGKVAAKPAANAKAKAKFSPLFGERK